MIDFELSPDQVAIQKAVRDFAEAELKPAAMALDRLPDHETIFPVELFEKSFALGIHRAAIPRRYGGEGFDGVTCAIIWEELAAGDAGFCVSYQGHFLAIERICSAGTDAQRERFLGALTSGEGGLAAFALTEPNVGPCWLLLQDDYVLETRITRDGDDWRINGTKTFCTNGGSPLTKWYVIWGRSDMRRVGLESCSVALVDADTPGLTAPRTEDKMGQRLSTNAQLVLDDVRVPHENVVGALDRSEVPERLQTANSWVLLGALCVGIARSAFEEALKYAKHRKIMGKPAIEHQLIAAKLADMHWQIEAARTFVWKAARHYDTREIPDVTLAQGAKVFASDMAVRVANEALQVHGGIGYVKGMLVEKLYRDARITQIYECPNELLRVSTAGHLAMRPD